MCPTVTILIMEIILMTMPANIPVLPDWTRWSWRSADERDWWMPLFTRASNAYQDVERLSVVHRLRPAAFQNVDSDKLIDATRWAAQHNILCIPQTTVGVASSYSSTTQPIRDGKFAYRVLYLHPDYYNKAFPQTDAEFGDVLGYPACCRDAYAHTWGQGHVDSTWEQTREGTQPNGLPLTSTLMRWMGMRLVSHMPCTYTCTESQAIAQAMFDLGCAHGYREEMYTIREVLSWPLKWSRLFGIAEIVTPALKISTRSDWTPKKQEFFRNGHYERVRKTLWTDNQFSSAQGMRETHEDMLPALLTQLPQDARVLDLGCGNGHLLRRLTIYRPDLRIAGVDTNADAIQRAQHPMSLTARFMAARIQDGTWRDWKPTAVLFNPARLTEMPPSDAKCVAEWIREVPQQFPYLYSDWQTRTDVSTLCTEYGLGTPQPLIKTPKVEMGVMAPFT